MKIYSANKKLRGSGGEAPSRYRINDEIDENGGLEAKPPAAIEIIDESIGFFFGF